MWPTDNELIEVNDEHRKLEVFSRLQPNKCCNCCNETSNNNYNKNNNKKSMMTRPSFALWHRGVDGHNSTSPLALSSILASTSKKQKQNNTMRMTQMILMTICVLSVSLIQVMGAELGQLNANIGQSSTVNDVYAAIKAHPRLTQFAKLIESDGVRLLVATDLKTEFTVFAPVDEALVDLVSKAKSRQINLVDLAKHHIVPELIAGDDDISHYPLAVQSFSRASPLILTRGRSTPTSEKDDVTYVNNARIIDTLVFTSSSSSSSSSSSNNGGSSTNGNSNNSENDDESNGGSVTQVLHIIDHVIERLSLPPQMTSIASSQQRQHVKASVRRPVTLDALLANQQVMFEFYERHSDLLMGANPMANSMHTRADSFVSLTMNPIASFFRSSSSSSSSSSRRPHAIGRDEFDLSSLMAAIQAQPEVASLFLHTNQSSHSLSSSSSSSSIHGHNNDNGKQELNTYFVPLVGGARAFGVPHVARAHVIRGQVLFTRPMGVGNSAAHMSFDSSDSSGCQVHLSLAKQLSQSATSGQQQQQQEPMTTPLLVQSSTYCADDSNNRFTSGIVTSEIVLANLATTSGVVHLIRRPLAHAERPIIDYINDHEGIASDLLSATGAVCHTRKSESVDSNSIIRSSSSSSSSSSQVNRFRELLARDRLLQAELASGAPKTLLVPSDAAFERMRFDYRRLLAGNPLALVHLHTSSSTTNDMNPADRLVGSGDEQLVGRILRHHILAGQRILVNSSAQSTHHHSSNQEHIQYGALSGELVALGGSRVSGPSSSLSANIELFDLAGSDGLVHIIDRVLGTPDKTVYSVLQEAGSSSSSDSSAGSAVWWLDELNSLIEHNMNNNKQLIVSYEATLATASTPSTNSFNYLNGQSEQQTTDNNGQHVISATTATGGIQQPFVDDHKWKLYVIGESIRQFLQDLDVTRLDALGTSANVTYRLADAGCPQDSTSMMSSSATTTTTTTIGDRQRLCGFNDEFKEREQQFTYFVPSDTAWLRLQQAHPHLYEPMARLLNSSRSFFPVSFTSSAFDSSSSVSQSLDEPNNEAASRLLHVLERHVVAGRKLTEKELQNMNEVRTIRDTLRLVDDKLPSSSSLVSNPSSDSIGKPQTRPDEHQTNGIHKALVWQSTAAHIVRSDEAVNGVVHIIDSVMGTSRDFGTDNPNVGSSSLSSLTGSPASLFGASLVSSATNLLARVQPMHNMILIGCLCFIALTAVIMMRRRHLSRSQKRQRMSSSSPSGSSGPSASATASDDDDNEALHRAVSSSSGSSTAVSVTCKLTGKKNHSPV